MRPSKRFLLFALALAFTARLSADITTVYNFEHGTDGFDGNTSTSTLWASSGQHSLAIDATGSTGWNQNLAVNGSNNVDWTHAVEFLCDVYMPAGTKAAATYVQFIPTFSGPVNSFYQAGKVDLVDGVNHVALKINGSQITTPWKIYLILNTGGAIPGKIYVDDIRMRTPGKPGRLTLTLRTPYGSPVPGVVVAAGTAAVTTDSGGRAVLALPSDNYDAEVLGSDVVDTPFTARVPVGDGSQEVTVSYLPRTPPRRAQVVVRAGSVLRPFDADHVYGHNLAMWSGLDPFTNPIQKAKLLAIRTRLIRLPGGEYGNQWNWRTGGIFKQTADAPLDWTPEANWDVWKTFLHGLGPQTEALMILNVFQSTPQEQVAWIRNALDSGLKVPYVELGNEPDLDPNRYMSGVPGGSTVLSNYVRTVLPFARAVRAAFPNIKILGPVIAQIDDPVCPGKHPWDCYQYVNGEQVDNTRDNWIHKFLALYSSLGGPLDGVSFHSYPFYEKWDNHPTGYWDATQAWTKIPKLVPWMRRYEKWMAQYYPSQAGRMELGMTEFNMQVDETWATAAVEDAVWNAAYLGEFIRGGGTLATDWDINTEKPTDGGGHGFLDPNNDPTRPYAERARYWLYKMMANNFTGDLVRSTSSSPMVEVYAASDRGRVTVLLINHDENRPADATLYVAGAGDATRLRVMSLSRRNYLWSKVLYRAVLNLDPTVPPQVKVYGVPPERSGWRVYTQHLDPMSVTMAVFE